MRYRKSCSIPHAKSLDKCPKAAVAPLWISCVAHRLIRPISPKLPYFQGSFRLATRRCESLVSRACRDENRPVAPRLHLDRIRRRAHQNSLLEDFEICWILQRYFRFSWPTYSSFTLPSLAREARWRPPSVPDESRFLTPAKSFPANEFPANEPDHAAKTRLCHALLSFF